MRSLLTTEADEIVARSFTGTRIPLTARQPIAVAQKAAHAALRNLARFTPSAHLLNVSVHTAGQGWRGVLAGR
jgi:hypothetical protein